MLIFSNRSKLSCLISDHSLKALTVLKALLIYIRYTVTAVSLLFGLMQRMLLATCCCITGSSAAASITAAQLLVAVACITGSSAAIYHCCAAALAVVYITGSQLL